jgi:hypothetical protein
MLDRTEQRLAIIEDFRPDRNLPKYIRIEKERREKQKKAHWSPDFEVEFSDNSNDFIVSSGNTGELQSLVVRPVGTVYPAKGLLARIWNWFLSWFKKPEPIHRISILEFFSNIKSSAQDIDIVKSRAAGYEQAIIKAKQTGQTALLEKLKDGLNAFRMETLMLSIGITSFISEQTIVEFYKKSEKGVRLNYMKNFVRPVPDNLAQLKAKADELEIFDNYAVLHYDPDEKSYAETKAEIAARKDPILFGILKGRSDLYVIGDWVDDMCDLTLDKMAEILGRSAEEKLETELERT